MRSLIGNLIFAFLAIFCSNHKPRVFAMMHDFSYCIAKIAKRGR